MTSFSTASLLKQWLILTVFHNGEPVAELIKLSFLHFSQTPPHPPTPFTLHSHPPHPPTPLQRRDTMCKTRHQCLAGFQASAITDLSHRLFATYLYFAKCVIFLAPEQIYLHNCV